MSEIWHAVVVRIGVRFEELAVAPGATDVLGRATAGCFDQAWVRDPGLRISGPLDADRVFPAIAEVVEVFERLEAGVLDDVSEAGLAGVEWAAIEVRGWNAPPDVAGS
jgi:hypothetical protein